MVAFYKHDIASWMDGTASLTSNAYRAYHVICQMIYSNEGPVAHNERYLAGACNLSVKAFRIALKELTDGEKVTLSDGKLTNSRAVLELEFVNLNRENASKGGKSSGKSRQKNKNINKISNTNEATLQIDRSLRDETRRDETREDERGALRAPAPPEEPDGYGGLTPEKTLPGITEPEVKPAPKRKPVPKSKSNRRPSLVAWPDDFVLGPEQMEYARRGLSEVEAAKAWARFRETSAAKAYRYADWNAAWRNWVRSDVERLGRTMRGEKVATPAAPTELTTEQWKSILAIYATTNNWPLSTPPPGDPGCIVPPELLPPDEPELI